MTRTLIILFAVTGFVCGAQNPGRAPVLLELFTSEGCSSCPPADQLLTKLDREQPVSDVELIVIGEHVDYWNRGGWSDPYSSPAFSQRQQHYAALLHADDVYTPQLVVDGTSQLVGSNWPKAKAAIEAAQHSQKLTISLELSDTGAKRKLNTKIGASSSFTSGDVFLVLAADAVNTQVSGGENSGRHLFHTAVAYSIMKIGSISARSGFENTSSISTHSKWGSETRIVVFVQDPKTGRVLGASRAKL